MFHLYNTTTKLNKSLKTFIDFNDLAVFKMFTFCKGVARQHNTDVQCWANFIKSSLSGLSST